MLNSEGAQRYEVYNFAVSGYGTEAQLELYRTKVEQYQPDLLLQSYVLNDPMPTSIVVETVKKVTRKAKFFAKLSSKTQFGAWVYVQYHGLKNRLATERNFKYVFAKDETWQALDAAMLKLQMASRKLGGEFAMVVFPLLVDYEDYEFAEEHRRIGDVLEKYAIPYLDMLPYYAEYPNEQLRVNPEDNTHPNALGHKIAAEQILRFLKARQLLP